MPAQERHRERTHRVAMLAYPDAQILDITGPLEVFARASRWIEEHVRSGAPAYSVEIVAREKGPVLTSGGLAVVAGRACSAFEGADTLLVTGGIGYRAVVEDAGLLEWLSAAAALSERVGSICNGALILAAARLLDGREAATHWAYCDALASAAPSCRVRADALHVRDGNIYTSAGVTAGMDLALAMVEEDWGRPIALRVAQELVMYLVRPGGQSQFSRQLQAQLREGPLGRVDLFMIEKLGEDLSVERLADVAAMSPRHFARRFAEEYGMPPAAHVMRLRVERARGTLEAGSSRLLKDIARECGFGSEQNLRRAFVRTLGVTPEEYRQRFGSRPGGSERFSSSSS